jgi:hypothetical protein
MNSAWRVRVFVFFILIICGCAWAAGQTVTGSGTPEPSTVKKQPAEWTTIRIQGQEGAGAFSPKNQRPIKKRFDGMTVRLVKKKNGLAVVLQNPRDMIVDLPVEMVQVDDIDLVASQKVVVLGRVNGSVSQVAVISTQTGKLIDTLYCYEPETFDKQAFYGAYQILPAPFCGKRLRRVRAL